MCVLVLLEYVGEFCQAVYCVAGLDVWFLFRVLTGWLWSVFEEGSFYEDGSNSCVLCAWMPALGVSPTNMAFDGCVLRVWRAFWKISGLGLRLFMAAEIITV